MLECAAMSMGVHRGYSDLLSRDYAADRLSGSGSTTVKLGVAGRSRTPDDFRVVLRSAGGPDCRALSGFSRSDFKERAEFWPS